MPSGLLVTVPEPAPAVIEVSRTDEAAVSELVARRVRTSADFFVAGRNLPASALFATFLKQRAGSAWESQTGNLRRWILQPANPIAAVADGICDPASVYPNRPSPNTAQEPAIHPGASRIRQGIPAVARSPWRMARPNCWAGRRPAWPGSSCGRARPAKISPSS